MNRFSEDGSLRHQGTNRRAKRRKEAGDDPADATVSQTHFAGVRPGSERGEICKGGFPTRPLKRRRGQTRAGRKLLEARVYQTEQPRVGIRCKTVVGFKHKQGKGGTGR